LTHLPSRSGGEAEGGEHSNRPLVVHVVPHTHWDREWYLSFPVFRIRLDRLVADLLQAMQGDSRLRFTLDGQLATVDDYLELEPQDEPRLRALVEQGRLSVGPWYTLVDEFLVSGESIVRNLELGMARGERVGGVMPIGYLPDSFGHIAQMPQILRRVGIDDAVVYRGVPAAIDWHSFRWESPDGSAVRAEYLPLSYDNAAHLLDPPVRAAPRMERLWAALEPFFGPDEPLAMLGTDHMSPHPRLAEMIDQANREQGALRFELETLAEYLARKRPDGRLLSWRGELRSGARANLLMGVVSTHVELKAACARAERMIERYAEPFQALYGERWPEQALGMCWRRLAENAAHDTICGCSADAVIAQALARFIDVEELGSALTLQALEHLARHVPRSDFLVANPTPHERTALIELEVEVPESWSEVALELPDGRLLPTQERSRRPALPLFTEELPGSALPKLLRPVPGRGLFEHTLNGLDVDAQTRRLVLDVGRTADPSELDLDQIVDHLAALADSDGERPWQVEVRARPRRRLAALVPVPPLGAVSVRPTPARSPAVDGMRTGERSIANEFLELEASGDGTLRLVGNGVEIEGLGRLVDGGDGGDSYNYAPPAADAVLAEPHLVRAEVRTDGPLVAELAIVSSYMWPVGLADPGEARSSERTLTEVTTSAVLRAGEPFVRITVIFDNRCRDHRVRFHVPLPATADSSFAEGQFAVVERGPAAEGGHGEHPLPTFPARGFVDAGGMAVLLEHVLEYELVGGCELALTLLRATGLISRTSNNYRAEPAGPELAIPGAQCLGDRTVSFALYPHQGTWVQAGVVAGAEHYAHGFVTVRGSSDAAEPLDRAGLSISGECVVMSSLRRRGEWFELRLVLEAPEPRAALISGALREARNCDLLGQPGEPLSVVNGSLRLDLRPWEIRTVQLR
jgi:mannosylglycerate hydrolase